MKYLAATIVLFIALILGWVISAKYLEPVIRMAFKPETHEQYMDLWFSVFSVIEVAAVLSYVVYVYKLFKSSSDRRKEAR